VAERFLEGGCSLITSLDKTKVTIGKAAAPTLTYAGIRGSLPAQLYRVRQPIWEKSTQPSNYRQPIRNLIG
jgi:hypothetical protein